MRLLAVCVMALLFGFVGSMPLAGPIAILVLSRATQGRFGEALRIGLGAAVAEGLYAGLAFWGFTTFLARHAIVVPISHGVTAVVLLALGVRFMFWSADAGQGKPRSGAGTLFYPINPGHEEASWERFYKEMCDRFFNGSYAGSCEAGLIAEFDRYLPEQPPWKR